MEVRYELNVLLELFLQLELLPESTEMQESILLRSHLVVPLARLELILHLVQQHELPVWQASIRMLEQVFDRLA
jgi:hypothetical protein